MSKIITSLKKLAGRLIVLLPTYEYIGYQVGIRKHDRNLNTTRGLARNWKYTFGALLGGRRLYLDFWIVAKDKKYKPVMKYKWKLCYPDGKQVNDVGGKGVADMTSNKMHKAVLGLGHFSIPGAYRIDLKISNDVNGEILSEVVDFDVYSFSRIESIIFQAALIVILTLFFSAILKTCGFPE